MTLRRTPIRRKRPTARRYKSPRCVGLWGKKGGGCKRPAAELARCRKHRHAYLDAIAGLATRTDRCEFPHPFPCAGPVQCNHGIDRGDVGTRWDLRNLFSGCAGLNTWAHNNKRRWYAMVRAKVGDAVYAELEALADKPPKPDYEAIEAAILASLEARGMMPESVKKSV